MTNDMTTNAERARELLLKIRKSGRANWTWPKRKALADELESIVEPLLSQAQQGVAVAWLASDGSGRVIDAKAKAAGGRTKATGSATVIYSIPLYTAPPAPVADAVRELAEIWKGIGPVGYLTYADAARFLEAALAAQPAECVASETGKHSEDVDGRTPGWCEHCSVQIGAAQPGVSISLDDLIDEWCGRDSELAAAVDAARKRRAAQPGAGERFALVPREPTDTMLNEARLALGSDEDDFLADDVRTVWDAMLTAAQAQGGGS